MPESRSDRAERRLGLMMLGLSLAPALLATWLVPAFVTQDGPAHLYNAEILRASLRPGSPYAGAFEVRWSPLPNWAGHLTLIGLLELLPPRVADRAMMTLTLVGFAGSVAWLRLRVAGPRGFPAAALLAAVLGMNVTWLFGFGSFLLGASLFGLTLGVWWGGFERGRLGPGRASALMGLLTLGYFCHPISLAATVAGLVALALLTPGERRGSRLGWTLLAMLPLVPLGLAYRAAIGRGGAIEPVWIFLEAPFRLKSWFEQLAWVDPITLGRKSALPFVPWRSTAFWLLQPATLVIIAGLAFAASSLLRRGGGPRGHLRGWAALAGLLIVGGLIGPDTLGRTHGFYLAQRVLLLGLAAAVVLIGADGRPMPRRIGAAALGLAAAIQAGFVVEYSRYSGRVVGPVLTAAPEVGRGVRLGVLWIDLRGPYRANPLLHSETLLGLGGNVVWSNYEAAHYYFPVQPRPDVPHPPPLAFEEVSILDSPEDADRRARDWEALLAEHAGRIDVLIVRGRDPTLDAITRRWYEMTYDDPSGGIRLFRRRENLGLSSVVQ